jgi:hypothetical protein
MSGAACLTQKRAGQRFISTVLNLFTRISMNVSHNIQFRAHNWPHKSQLKWQLVMSSLSVPSVLPDPESEMLFQTETPCLTKEVTSSTR